MEPLNPTSPSTATPKIPVPFAEFDFEGNLNNTGTCDCSLALIEGDTRFEPGVRGSALYFGGSTGYEINGLPDSFWKGSYTVAMWVNMRNNGPMIAHGSAAGTGPNLAVRNLTIHFFSTDFNDGIAGDSIQVLPDFIHLAVTFDGMTAKLYENARKVSSGALASSGEGVRTFLGSMYGIEAERFFGTIDDLRLFDVALTPAQIFSLVNM